VSMANEQQKKEFGKEMLILSQINHKYCQATGMLP